MHPAWLPASRDGTCRTGLALFHPSPNLAFGERMSLKAVILAAVAWAGLAGSASAGQVLDTIRQHGVLRVGTTGDYKPFTFRNPDGSYYGADIDMAAPAGRPARREGSSSCRRYGRS